MPRLVAALNSTALHGEGTIYGYGIVDSVFYYFQFSLMFFTVVEWFEDLQLYISSDRCET